MEFYKKVVPTRTSICIKRQASIEKLISLKPLFFKIKGGIIYLKIGIWLHPRFHRQADGGKPNVLEIERFCKK